MNKQKLSLAILLATLSSISVFFMTNNHEAEFNPLTLANIEALSRGEVTVVGCRAMKNSTCYVFDGNGQLVDKQKNQYK